MGKRNIIIISLDEVRPDHLSCYGYKRIETPAIDRVAKEGVRFETCISSSDFTPVAMGSALTGKYPNKHGMRDAYSYITGPLIAEILKKHGYNTSGFTGNGLTITKSGFAQGFDIFKEPTKETYTIEFQYQGRKETVGGGYFWVDDFFEWFKDNHQEPFFIWGHLLETHEGFESWLLKQGLIKEGELSDSSYCDAKIKMADEKLVARLLDALDKSGLSENTTLVVMSDHGADLGAHPADPVTWRSYEITYPQHTTMYDCDLRVAMIIKGEGLPEGKVVKGMVRSIDLVPTLLDLAGFSTEEYDFDGLSLLPVIEKGKAEGREVYSEDLFEARGKGALQSIRTDTSKFIRNLTLGTEEYYDLPKDPEEQNNIKDTVDKDTLISLRKKLNAFLETRVSKVKEMSGKEKEEIDSRLRGLGYIE